MTIEFVLLILGSYLLGSVPAAYLTAKWFRGIDIRQSGTGNVGATNLLVLTSKRMATPVIIFDLIKGMIMVWVAHWVGLSIAQQVAVGLVAIIGHDWPVFLRFNGGRGVITTLGVAFILPLINGLVPWEIVVFLVIMGVFVFATHTTPLGIGISLAAMPLVSWLFNEPLSLTLGFLTMFLILVIRRLTVPRTADFASVSRKQLFINRLLFDRDIRDKEAWIHRAPPKTSSSKQPISQQARQKKG